METTYMYFKYLGGVGWGGEGCVDWVDLIRGQESSNALENELCQGSCPNILNCSNCNMSFMKYTRNSDSYHMARIITGAM